MKPYRSYVVAIVCALAIALAPATILHAELVAYWNFDGNVDDQSPAGINDGELIDAVYSDNVPAAIGTGQSLSFEFDTDHVFVPADDSLNSDTFTLAFFAFDRGQVGAFERFTSRENDVFETAINIHPPSEGVGEISYFASAGGGWQWTAEQWGADDSIVLEEEAWQHVAYVADFEEQTMMIYLDGEQVFEAFDPWFSNLEEVEAGFMHIGNRWNDVEGFDGMMDDVALWDEVLSAEQIMTVATGGVTAFLGGGNPLDRLNDGSLTGDERLAYVHDVLGTWMGDSNWMDDSDREFNSSDLVVVFSAGQYETGGAAGWEEGDWNGDMVFNSSDLVTAFSDGGYERGPFQAPAAVPEPSSIVLLLIGSLLIVRSQK